MGKELLIISLYIALTFFLANNAMAECEDAVANMDIIACERREYENVSRILAEVLQRIQTHLYLHDRKAFDEGQKAWVAYRKAHCDSLVSTYWGGSMGPTVGMKCFADLTKDRIKQLRSDFADAFP